MHEIRTQIQEIQINQQSQYVRSSWMVELTGIPAMQNENVFDYINHLADIAKIDNFIQEQIDTAHRTSNKADTPIIILFIKKRQKKLVQATQKAQKHNCPPFFRITWSQR